MEWNVYVHNINRDRIEKYNVFEHSSFIKYLKKACEECESKDMLAEKIKSELRYYFWSKSQWELIISPWVGYSKPFNIKVDVYDQVMMNFDIFVDYVWKNRKELLEL
jgi:hypothetical protein